jgi:hypothetical protein
MFDETRSGTMYNLAGAHLIPFARTKIFFDCEDEIAGHGA